MSIYAIGDLHFSTAVNKPMNIFGDNWENHELKIIEDWKKEIEKTAKDCDFPVSASVGYAVGKRERLEDVIAVADQNMYLCKQKAHRDGI